MKKLQVPLETELFKELKMYCIDNDKTIKEVVTKLLEELLYFKEC